MLIGCLLLCGPAWADIEVDIKGVNDELRRNVLTYLSFERYKKRPNIDRDTLDRLLNRVDREVQAALKPFGYYEPKVDANLAARTRPSTSCTSASPRTCRCRSGHA